MNIDDCLQVCLMGKFLTPPTCKLETKSHIDTAFTIIDQNNRALVIFFFSFLFFFFKVGNLG